MNWIRTSRKLLAVLTLLSISPLAAPQTKPLRIVVPYPPGGTQDAMMRLLQEPLGKLLEQPVVVENRAGAAGMIGMQEVNRAAPDGNTLVLANNGMVITPLIQQSAALELASDFTPVSIIASGPLVLFTHPSLPVNNVKELIAYAKTQPNGLNYGSTGTGGLGHMTFELLARQADLKLTHIPYKGNAPAMLALLGGEVPMVISTVSDTTNQNVKAGKMKAIAVTTPEASSAVPGTPPISEAVPGFGVTVWFGFVAPPGVAPATVAKLSAAIQKVMDEPEVRKRFESFGLIAGSSGPKAFVAAINQEAAIWRPVVRSANIKAQ